MTNQKSPIRMYLRSFNYTDDGMAEVEDVRGTVETGDYVRTSDYLLVRREAEYEIERLTADLAHREQYAAQMNEVLKENARLNEKLVEVERLAANNITGGGTCTTIIQAVRGAVEPTAHLQQLTERAKGKPVDLDDVGSPHLKETL